MDVLFLCEVPRFTAAGAKAVEDFTRTGGTTVIFLGPGVDAANYNDMLVQQVASEGGLLPGRLDKAVGEIGPEATSVKIGKVAVDHPFFAGLYENQADYLTVLVQRYYRLAASANPGVTLVQLADGQPLIVDKRFGGGRVVLCATTCGPSSVQPAHQRAVPADARPHEPAGPPRAVPRRDLPGRPPATHPPGPVAAGRGGR